MTFSTVSPFANDEPSAATGRPCVAQLLVCALGCCCGRVDKGKPGVPVEALKAAWRERRLNPKVQLTLTGCLGPCDRLNVVGILTPEGTTWLGALDAPWHFAALLDWASAVHASRTPLPLPDALRPHAFRRFPSASLPPSPE